MRDVEAEAGAADIRREHSALAVAQEEHEVRATMDSMLLSLEAEERVRRERDDRYSQHDSLAQAVLDLKVRRHDAILRVMDDGLDRFDRPSHCPLREEQGR